MRHLFTFILICALSTVNAQVFSENFDSGVPGSMTQTTINGNLNWAGCGANTGGAPCPIDGSGSATFYAGNYTAYSTALSTPTLDLSSGVHKVKFTLAKRSWAGDINELHVDISTDGGTTWSVMESYLDEVYDPTDYSITLSPFNPTATTQVRFRAINHYGYRLILDNVEINEVTTDDIQLTGVDIPSIIPQGNTEVKGSFKNEGFNVLTSFDLNWQVDGGEVHTQTYSGQNIIPGQEFNFTHSELWASTVGLHDIRVWISNTNVSDTDTSNDEMTSSISVASGSVAKIPIFEKFSSSTCPPCYSFNTNTFNPFFDSYGHDKATYISYQVNWPGAGDPYYTAETGARVSYYGISAAPSLLLNAGEINVLSATQTTLQNDLDDVLENDNLGFFAIDSDHTIDGNNITVNIDVMPYLSGDFVVRAMVIEKVTTDNVATNGETEFHHVFMKALPNASGTTLTFEHDVPQSLELTADLSSTNVEEMDDLAVVVFIQDNSDKQILQSAYTESSNIVLGTNEVMSNSISIVPNPTTGIVRLMAKENVDVQIYDLTGKNVFNQNKVSSNTTLDLTGLGNGIYLVKITDEKGIQTIKKLIVK